LLVAVVAAGAEVFAAGAAFPVGTGFADFSATGAAEAEGAAEVAAVAVSTGCVVVAPSAVPGAVAEEGGGAGSSPLAVSAGFSFEASAVVGLAVPASAVGRL
jgi:hypothetical protein